MADPAVNIDFDLLARQPLSEKTEIMRLLRQRLGTLTVTPQMPEQARTQIENQRRSLQSDIDRVQSLIDNHQPTDRELTPPARPAPGPREIIAEQEIQDAADPQARQALSDMRDSLQGHLQRIQTQTQEDVARLHNAIRVLEHRGISANAAEINRLRAERARIEKEADEAIAAINRNIRLINSSLESRWNTADRSQAYQLLQMLRESPPSVRRLPQNIQDELARINTEFQESVVATREGEPPPRPGQIPPEGPGRGIDGGMGPAGAQTGSDRFMSDFEQDSRFPGMDEISTGRQRALTGSQEHRDALSIGEARQKTAEEQRLEYFTRLADRYNQELFHKGGTRGVRAASRLFGAGGVTEGEAGEVYRMLPIEIEDQRQQEIFRQLYGDRARYEDLERFKEANETLNALLQGTELDKNAIEKLIAANDQQLRQQMNLDWQEIRNRLTILQQGIPYEEIMQPLLAAFDGDMMRMTEVMSAYARGIGPSGLALMAGALGIDLPGWADTVLANVADNFIGRDRAQVAGFLGQHGVSRNRFSRGVRW